MDESLQELETELKALRPRRLSARLIGQIERELGASPAASARSGHPRYVTATNLNSWKWLGWRAAGVAATLSLLAWWTMARQPERSPPLIATAAAVAQPNASPARPMDARTRFEPVAATNVLYDLKDEGLVKIGEERARRVVVRYLDTYTWKNPSTNASLQWSVPRDEVRVVPATFN